MDQSISKEDLSYVIDHVFLPPKLPQADDFDVTKEHSLCSLVHGAAQEYTLFTADERWNPIPKMLKLIHEAHRSHVLSNDQIIASMAAMQSGGDIFPLPFALD